MFGPKLNFVISCALLCLRSGLEIAIELFSSRQELWLRKAANVKEENYEAVMGSKIFRRSNSDPSLKWSFIVENLSIVGKRFVADSSSSFVVASTIHRRKHHSSSQTSFVVASNIHHRKHHSSSQATFIIANIIRRRKVVRRRKVHRRGQAKETPAGAVCDVICSAPW